MPFTASERAWLKPMVVAVAALVVAPSQAGEILPRSTLFDPLIADPRWAHFSAAWHDYGGDQDLGNVATVSLGEDFSLYQAEAPRGRWGIDFQAGVFAIFDLDASSSDLVNADYLVGIPVSWRDGPWQARARVYHQSSHLGDEYLLRVRPERVNLSYEGVDLKVSRTLADNILRLYGGAGYLVHTTPDLEPWSFQFGAEVRPPWTFAQGHLHPVAAVDLQLSEEADWKVNVSSRVGFELIGDPDRDYRLLIALEYFNGRNPNGQLYQSTVDYWGIGLHAFF